jgi:hypothetical protein
LFILFEIVLSIIFEAVIGIAGEDILGLVLVGRLEFCMGAPITLILTEGASFLITLSPVSLILKIYELKSLALLMY